MARTDRRIKADENAYEEYLAKQSRYNARNANEKREKRKESYAKAEADERMDAALACFYEASEDESEAGPSSMPLKGTATSDAAASSSFAPSRKCKGNAPSSSDNHLENAVSNYMAGLSESSAPRKAEPERTRKRKLNSALTYFYEPDEHEGETASSSKLRNQAAGKHAKAVSSPTPHKKQVRTQVNVASSANASLKQTSRATAKPHGATSSAASSFMPSSKQASSAPRMRTSTSSINQATSAPRTGTSTSSINQATSALCEATSNVCPSSKRPGKQASNVSSKTTSRAGSSSRKQTNSTSGNTASTPPFDAHPKQAAGPAPLKHATANGTPSLSPSLKTAAGNTIAVHPNDATLKQAAGNAARKRPRLAQTDVAAPRSYL
ncbi:hypothetical protein BDZ90DRAFT_173195 [Jaminaea rosea]|uniref:Uncharacterized protein n=1 Tax=Jaminaea rosea TaxID=1569628 RepID=A0A316URA9_9BASI|nr:hypothetical protein BDZ90DRAFT_173195 [Jaminaea rosea]PWN27832.1 hypothetical protein BDZ90DRAFT_173195 [Jaminaea rosea]